MDLTGLFPINRYYETKRNPYDMYKFGDYAEEKQIAYYLNRSVLECEV